MIHIAHITSLLEVGQLSLELRRAETAYKTNLATYHDKIKKFEEEHGQIIGRIDPRIDDYAAVIAYTKPEFEASQDAKRKAYNIKRRWQNACRKAAGEWAKYQIADHEIA